MSIGVFDGMGEGGDVVAHSRLLHQSIAFDTQWF